MKQKDFAYRVETDKSFENREVFNKWASSYDFPLFQWWMKKFHKPVLDKIDFSKKPKILDISCGTGELLTSISKKGTADLYGVDIAERMLSEAGKKLPDSAKLKKADVHLLPFPNNTFDYVMSTEAFHHYYNQPLALKEMVRVTKPGGKVIVVDINFFLRLIHWLFEKLEPGCVHVNSKEEMLIHFRTAGLREIYQKRTFAFAIATRGIK